MSHSGHEAASQPLPTGPFAWYHKIPLFARILFALVLGVVFGELMANAGKLGHIGPISIGNVVVDMVVTFKQISAVVLRLLSALATPLIFVAVVSALYKANITGKTGLKLVLLLLTNTVVAILVGLLVANVLQPGHHTDVKIKTKALTQKAFDPVEDLLGKIPAVF